jgi:hypothetical protein
MGQKERETNCRHHSPVSLSCLSSLQLQTILMLFYDQSRQAESIGWKLQEIYNCDQCEQRNQDIIIHAHCSHQLLIYSFIMSRRERERLLGFRVKIRESWTVMMMITRELMASEIDTGESKDVDK